MNRRGSLFVSCAVVWGALAPLIRVGVVSRDTLVFSELLTVIFRFGFFTLVLPLLVSGMIWAWFAPWLWRQKIRWWLIPGTAFALSQVAILLGSPGLAESLRLELFRTLWPIVVTGLAVAAGSSLVAIWFLRENR